MIIMEMKKMIYKDLYIDKCREKEVLFSGIYKGRKFSIVSLGSHPVAYVSMREGEPKDYYDDYYKCIEVHGGFTYCDKSYWDDDKENWYLGWDYAHCDDCWGAFSKCRRNGKKWTTEEIYDEVQYVIEQLNTTFCRNGLKDETDIMKNEDLVLKCVCEMYKVALDLDKQYIKGLEEAIAEQKELIDGLDKEVDKGTAIIKTADKMVKELMQENEELKRKCRECKECRIMKDLGELDKHNQMLLAYIQKTQGIKDIHKWYNELIRKE